MFITFEGINGSGKSTQAKMLFNYLQSIGKDVILTKEPGGGGDFCMQIRRLLCQTNDISKLTEMFLLLAARKEHIDKLISPALSDGKIVICDRYIDSTIAYKGVARHLGIDNVLKINSFALDYMPDLTIFIDVTPDVALKRLVLRDKTDRLDLEEVEYTVIRMSSENNGLFLNYNKFMEGMLKLWEAKY